MKVCAVFSFALFGLTQAVSPVKRVSLLQTKRTTKMQKNTDMRIPVAKPDAKSSCKDSEVFVRVQQGKQKPLCVAIDNVFSSPKFLDYDAIAQAPAKEFEEFMVRLRVGFNNEDVDKLIAALSDRKEDSEGSRYLHETMESFLSNGKNKDGFNDDWLANEKQESLENFRKSGTLCQLGADEKWLSDNLGAEFQGYFGCKSRATRSEEEAESPCEDPSKEVFIRLDNPKGECTAIADIVRYEPNYDDMETQPGFQFEKFMLQMRVEFKNDDLRKVLDAAHAETENFDTKGSERFRTLMDQFFDNAANMWNYFDDRLVKEPQSLCEVGADETWLKEILGKQDEKWMDQFKGC